MEQAEFFKSVIDQDEQPVVLCDTAHTIIYMNPAAVRRYEKRGGAALVGQNLMACHNADSAAVIERVVAWFEQDAGHNRVFAYRKESERADVYMIALRDGSGKLIGYYEKHESRAPDTGRFYALD